MNNENMNKNNAVNGDATNKERTKHRGIRVNQRPNSVYKRKSKKTNEVNQEKIKIIPLGGLEQIGMNITAFEYGDSIMVVDCGMAFPEDDMLGIDMVIPDVTYLEENLDRVKGFVITHGHEDHIGALPYVLQKINVTDRKSVV